MGDVFMNNDNLKIMTWNIDCRTKKRIKPEVVDKIIAQKADVVVLTEFAASEGFEYLLKQLQQLQENKYICYQATRTGKNGVLIAVKEDLIDSENEGENPGYFNFDDCNILKIRLPLKNGGHLCIVGCRIEIVYEKNDKAEYNRRGIAFSEILIPCVKAVDPDDYCIVCGDFNNAKCHGGHKNQKNPKDHGDLNQPYNPDDYKGYAQINYNVNIIKDEFEKLGFTMADIKKDGKPICTYSTKKDLTAPDIPDDHIFVKGFDVTNCDKDDYNKDEKRKYPSDHLLVTAKVSMKSEK